MLVVDASVLAVALADDGRDGDLARGRLRGEALAAPELVDLEVGSVLRRQERAGMLARRRGGLALTDLRSMPMLRASHAALLPRCWDLRENTSIYDAAYIALAEVFGAVLLTGDRRLARTIGATCEIEVLASTQ